MLRESAQMTECHAGTMETAGTVEPRQIGSAVDYQGLLELFRLRANELNVSRDVLDEVSGLGARYVSKLLGPRPVRRVGMATLGPLLGALGVRLMLVEDADAMRRFGSRNGFGKRNETVVRGGTVTIEFSRRYMQKIGRRGGLATQAKRRLGVTAPQRENLAVGVKRPSVHRHE